MGNFLRHHGFDIYFRFFSFFMKTCIPGKHPGENHVSFHLYLMCVNLVIQTKGSLVAQRFNALVSGARGARFNPCGRRRKVWCPNTVTFVSFAGMI